MSELFAAHFDTGCVLIGLGSINRRKSLLAEPLERRDLLTVSIELLRDINPGVENALDPDVPPDYAIFGDELYFTANDGEHGHELWKTDGTEDGTRLVKDIFEGELSSWPHGFVEFNNELFFAAADELGGELWKTDGTEGGTLQVADVLPGPGHSTPGDLTVFHDELFFSAFDLDGGQLFKTDGSEGNAELVFPFDDIQSFPFDLTIFQDEIYFSAADRFLGEELWKSDGTRRGTVLVADIFEGGDGSFPEFFFEFEDELYFIAADTATEFGLPPRLFKTDGTEFGTLRVTDRLVVLDPVRGLWNVTPFAGDIYFTSNGLDPTDTIELYRTDGTAGGSEELFLDLNGNDHSVPLTFTILGDELFFGATDRDTGRELWKTDGSLAGTTIVADALPGTLGVFPGELIAFDNEVYYRADDRTGWEVWKTDGSVDGTERLSDLNPNGDSVTTSGAFVEFAGKLLFRGQDGESGWEYFVISPLDAQQTIQGDIDADGSVAFPDFLILASNFGKTSSATLAEGDIDGDGTVAFPDFLIFSDNFGKQVAAARTFQPLGESLSDTVTRR